MNTAEALLASKALTSGVDAAFLLEMFMKVGLFVILCVFLAPYIPIVGKFIQGATTTMTALEKAVPKLAEKKWWAQTHTYLDFIASVTDLVALAEPMKDDDKDGTKRNARVKEGIRKLWGINHKWDKSQEEAVDEIIDICLNRMGNLGKLLKTGETSTFRPKGSTTSDI